MPEVVPKYALMGKLSVACTVGQLQRSPVNRGYPSRRFQFTAQRRDVFIILARVEFKGSYDDACACRARKCSIPVRI